MNRSIANEIRDALALDGFRPVARPDVIEFHGDLVVRNLRVPVRLVYPDAEYTMLPTLYVMDPAALPRPVVPHLTENGDLCVVERAAFVADRYLAAEQARGYIVRAAEVLDAGLFGDAVKAIATELPQHWGGARVGVEFGEYEGFAERSPNPNGIERIRPAVQSSAALGAYVITVPSTLSFESTQQRPSTFGEALDWLEFWAPGSSAKLLAGLGKLSSSDPTAVIVAPNGTIAFTVLVSAGGPKSVEALRRPAAWKTVIAGKLGRRFSIRRMQGHRMDLAYVLGRNGLDGKAPLADKRLVLVGCGAIGGFLGHSLAQLGAGLGAGELRLIDPDILDDANTRRHRLGAAHVGQAKAAASKSSIQECWPGLRVVDTRGRVEENRHHTERADLVVDATGEQAVGDMLNDWRIEQLRAGNAPMILHAWIEGNGSAARSFLNSIDNWACFRCLAPTHDEQQARYRVLRADAPRTLAAACGETPSTPYGPAAPMAAAALASQHAGEWALGQGQPLFRTVRLDLENTIDSKAVDPPKSAHCPACK